MKFRPSDIEDMKGKKDVDGLIMATKDPDVDIRNSAIGALRELKDPGAIDALTNALADSRTDVGAALALADIGGEAAINGLIHGLLYYDRLPDRLALYAVYSVNLIKHKKLAVSQLNHLFSFYGDENYTKLPPEKQIMSAKNRKKLREGITWVLGQMEDSRAVEPLIKALYDKELSIRQKAVDSLGVLKNRQAVTHLQKIINEKKLGKDVIEALGKIGGAEAIRILAQLLTDKDKKTRRNAAKALGDAGGNEAVEPLCAALKDKDKQVRVQARAALGKIGTPRALKAVESS